MTRGATTRATIIRAAIIAGAVAGTACGGVYSQSYFPASHNWAFRERYPAADRLFNGFDYGHAIVSEVLYARPRSAPVELERDQFELLTTRILLHPPNVALDGTAIAPGFTKLAPEVHLTFEWAHMLHRQIYDVLADERIKPADRDAQVARLVAYYRSRPDVALSSTPKSMELMEGQPYSSRTSPGLPTVMPMTAAVAPAFAARYPEAAIIFDNLHSLHDVVSDILASPIVPRDRRRQELLTALSRYRDDHSAVTSRGEWLDMSRAMGVDRMGGVAVRR